MRVLFELRLISHAAVQALFREEDIPFAPYPRLTVKFQDDHSAGILFDSFIWNHPRQRWEGRRDLIAIDHSKMGKEAAFFLERGWKAERPK